MGKKKSLGRLMQILIHKLGCRVWIRAQTYHGAVPEGAQIPRKPVRMVELSYRSEGRKMGVQMKSGGSRIQNAQPVSALACRFWNIWPLDGARYQPAGAVLSIFFLRPPGQSSNNFLAIFFSLRIPYEPTWRRAHHLLAHSQLSDSC